MTLRRALARRWPRRRPAPSSAITRAATLTLALLWGVLALACDRPGPTCKALRDQSQTRWDACELACAQRDEDACATLRELGLTLERAHPISAFEADRAGLRKLFESIIAAHQRGELAVAQAMARQLELPDPGGFFASRFGAQRGAALTRELERSPLKLYALPKAMASEHTRGRKVLLTDELISEQDEGATYTQHLALKLDQGQPKLKLYTLRMAREREEDGFALWSFIHDGQQFRYVGKLLHLEDHPPTDESLRAMRELPMRKVRHLLSQNPMMTLDELMGRR